MVRAHIDLLAESGQRERGIEIGFDYAAHLFNCHNLEITALLFARTASPAGTKTLFLCGFRHREEDDLLPGRTPAGTGRTAVDTGRAYGIDKGSVPAAVSGQDGMPPGCLVHVY